MSDRMPLSLAEIPALILVGGEGRRIRHLLPDLPKPMAPVAGRPFLEWILLYLARQGVRRVCLAAGYRADVLKQHFGSSPFAGMNITYVVEPKALGTGGALRYVAQQTGLTPPAWLVLNGDSLALADLSALTAAFAAPGVRASILAREEPDASRYGSLEVNAAGELVAFREKTSRPGSAAIINLGVYLLSHGLVESLADATPLSLEQDVFPVWVSQGERIRVTFTDAPFLDIGTEETLRQADHFIETRTDLGSADGASPAHESRPPASAS